MTHFQINRGFWRLLALPDSTELKATERNVGVGNDGKLGVRWQSIHRAIRFKSGCARCQTRFGRSASIPAARKIFRFNLSVRISE